MAEGHSNVVLIGMPGAGKSTVGARLAARTSRGFVDTDALIVASEGRPLQEIVDMAGYMTLRRIEEEVILGLRLSDHVVATGGSAAYSDAAMTHLKAHGLVVFLDCDMETLESRVGDFEARGLAKRPDQGFAELFAERLALYRKYADVTVECAGLSEEEVCLRIIGRIG
jgi:shikimate kinase